MSWSLEKPPHSKEFLNACLKDIPPLPFAISPETHSLCLFTPIAIILSSPSLFGDQKAVEEHLGFWGLPLRFQLDGQHMKVFFFLFLFFPFFFLFLFSFCFFCFFIEKRRFVRMIYCKLVQRFLLGLEIKLTGGQFKNYFHILPTYSVTPSFSFAISLFFLFFPLFLFLISCIFSVRYFLLLFYLLFFRSFHLCCFSPFWNCFLPFLCFFFVQIREVKQKNKKQKETTKERNRTREKERNK